MKPGEPATKMQFAGDPDGRLGQSGMWHGECARPHWDTVTPVLNRLKSLGGGF